ncbi:MAG: TIGR00730 family Rossman fold protein [Paludibacteraceae bacterium]|nr:TIGR00730 family Rossman fold protein [Paludibacteraceae bacterium]
MKIAVYCSAKDSIPEEYLVLGEQLGRWIGEQGYTLVYGGATGGLMSRTSNAAKAAGATVVGVIPPRIIAAGRKATNCDDLYLVPNMSARKQMMREMADVIVCLPGSYGTLDEMMDATASGTVGEHRKPVFVLNYNGFYQALIDQIQHMRVLRFIPEQEHYSPVFVDSMDSLKDAILNIEQKKE